MARSYILSPEPTAARISWLWRSVNDRVPFFLAFRIAPQQGQARMASSDLRGKSLVIIGGTTGLGFSAASAFLEQGARIVVTGRDRVNVRKAQKEFGKSACCFSADAIRPSSAVRAIK